jgi:hypothetical protein
MGRKCYKGRNWRKYKKKNACKNGRETEERQTKNEMEDVEDLRILVVVSGKQGHKNGMAGERF